MNKKKKKKQKTARKQSTATDQIINKQLHIQHRKRAKRITSSFKLLVPGWQRIKKDLPDA
jgi:hypothetical protein